MSSEALLHRVTENKRCHSRHFLELIDRFAQIFFFQVVQIKGIEFFENGLKVAFQATCSDHRFRQSRKDLCQLCNRGDTNFVPVIELLLTLRHALIGQIGWRILQKRCIEHVLK